MTKQLRPISYINYKENESNTDRLNKCAEEWEPPLGHGLHLHLVYAKSVRWCVVTRSSSVCQVPGRCHRVNVLKSLRLLVDTDVFIDPKAYKTQRESSSWGPIDLL